MKCILVFPLHYILYLTMARPKKPIDEKQVYKLAQLMCTHVEIASFFDVHSETIANRFADLIKRGHETGKMSLRRKQWALADKSPAMCIWLGKQYLGQVERTELNIPNAEEYFKQIADAISQSDTDSSRLLSGQTSLRN